MTLARISITLPRDVLAAADRRAKELDRSRSWVVAEALRQWLATGGARAVREPPSPPYVPGLGPSRLAQLEADLRLTPEERVRAAEETARLGEVVAGARRRPAGLLFFDRYEDYLEWKRREDVGL
ncbi:MAG: CopG family ribbon-helix-helix protein [Gemmatimonadales bacterium]